MKKILYFFCFFTATIAGAQENKPFVYQDNGKKDPLGPLVAPNGVLISYDMEITSSDIVLEGVVTDAQGNNLAILNGKIVKKGDKVLSYDVGDISVNEVDLIKGQEHLKIKIKKGASQ